MRLGRCLARVAVCIMLVGPALFPVATSAATATTAVVLPAAKPSAPARPTAASRPTAIELSWGAPSTTGGKRITAYRVQRKNPDGSWKTLTRTASARTRTYRATGLVNGRSYTFRVAAINADGVGPNSRTVSARPRPLALAPRSVTATAGDRSVTVRWSPPAANGSAATTGYRIQRRAEDGRFTTVATVTASKRSHRVTGLVNGDTERFRVNAVNSVGQGAFSPIVTVTLPVTSSVAAGGNHTCAVMPDTSVRCWGADDDGELGDGTVGDDSTVGVTVRGVDGTTALTGVASIDASDTNTCAVLIDGGVMCWGNNGFSQLGDDVLDGMSEFVTQVPRAVAVRTADGEGFVALDGAIQVAVGRNHACALLTDRTVRCWGGGAAGQRGDDTTTATVNHAVEVLTFLRVGETALTLDDVAEISAGDFHTCARLTSGSVVCWGDNTNGRIGDGTTDDAVIATPVSGIDNATSIGLGENHSCAVLSTGRAQCWGLGSFSQMGDGTANADNLVPVDVLASPVDDPLDGIATISGGKNHTCARMVDQTVRCWGYGLDGQAGDGDTQTRGTPVTVVTAPATPLTGATSLSVGGDHACARDSVGRLRCWGYNGDSQVGDGSTDNRLVAVAVSAI